MYFSLQPPAVSQQKKDERKLMVELCTSPKPVDGFWATAIKAGTSTTFQSYFSSAADRLTKQLSHEIPLQYVLTCAPYFYTFFTSGIICKLYYAEVLCFSETYRK